MAERTEDKIPDETLRRQFAVSDPQTSAWVSANAGTGKTHVLTQRVTRLLLDGNTPDRLLCLTFTKAAAAEMANRVFETLSKWAVCSERELRTSLHEFTGIRLMADQVAPARRLFAQALETPGGLKILTVHAFCERLLKQFPVEAGVRPGFAVLDDADAGFLLKQAHDSVIKTFADGSDAYRKLFRELLSRIPGGDLLNHVQRFANGEKGLPNSVATVENIVALFSLPDKLFAEARWDVPVDKLNGWIDLLSTGTKTDKDRALVLKTYLKSDQTAEDFESYLTAFLTQKRTPRANLLTKKLRTEAPTIEDEMLEEQDRLLKCLDAVVCAGIDAQTQALTAFAARVVDEYDRQKQMRGALDYDDLIAKAKDLLEKSSAAQWVLYKLDGGIDHILVDEAQDTSPDQWAVINALAEEYFAGEGAFEARGRPNQRTIFAVGDEKQSIYSFRGADPAMFHETRQRYHEASQSTQHNFAATELNLSFRSAPEILEIVDATFAEPSIAKILTPEGDPVSHAPRRASAPGLVELWPLFEPDDKPDVTPWDAPLDQESASAPHAELARSIADTIGQWLTDAVILKSQDRPIRPSDILILVRRRNILFEELVRELKRRNIPVAGADRLMLTEHIAVMDLMVLAQFLLLPEDDLALATVLKSPLIGMSENRLFELAHERKGSLWSALFQRTRKDVGSDWQKSYRYLSGLKSQIDTMPPFEFFKHVLDLDCPSLDSPQILSGRQAVVRRLGHDAEDPINEFINLSLAYEQSHVSGMQAFHTWLSKNQIELKREMDQDREEVRIMTVHGSKGLESNIVILPDTTRAPEGRNDLGLLNDEDGNAYWVPSKENDSQQTRLVRQFVDQQREAEYLRLLYVAMTRARDRLYIMGYKQTKPVSDKSWYNLITKAMHKKGAEVELPDGRKVVRLVKQEPLLSAASGAAVSAEDAATTRKPVPEFLQNVIDPNKDRADELQFVAPSKLGGDEKTPLFDTTLSPLAGDGENRFLHGRIVHKLLQYLPSLNAGDRWDKGKAYLLRNHGHELSADEQSALLTGTLAVIENPVFADLFGADSRAEVPIVGILNTQTQQIGVSGQVDRLAVTMDEVLIIDYKTNRPPPENPSQVAPIYIRQMALYRAVLNEMFPGRTIRCLLLWTESCRLMELPVEMLNQALEKI